MLQTVCIGPNDEKRFNQLIEIANMIKLDKDGTLTHDKIIKLCMV